MAEFILVLARVSVGLAVFAIGLTATIDDVTYVFRRPGKLCRALISMNVVMPVAAAILSFGFDLLPAVRIALGALAVSPTPPILPKKALNAGGRENYAVGLLVTVSVLAIVLVPLSIEAYQQVYGVSLATSPLAVAGIMVTTILAPLVAGVLVRRAAPELASRAAAPCSVTANILLVLVILPILFRMSGPMLSLIGDHGTLAALVVFAVVGLGSGYLLGGPYPEDRTVLGVYTATRHPGVAIAIAQANFPQQPRAIAVIVLSLLVSSIVAAPFISWSKTHHTTPASAAKR